MSETFLSKGNAINRKDMILFIILGLSPALIISIWLHIYPVFHGLGISFFRWSGLSANKMFIGLKNYRQLLSDPIVWLALKHDLYIIFFKSLATMTMAMLVSMILFYSGVRWRRVFQGIFFFPNILSVAIVSILFSFIYNPSIGLLNALLELFGLEQFTRSWLGESSTALNAILFPTIWGAVGYQMLLISAGLNAIPRIYFEVGRLEGISALQNFIYIIFPLLRNVLKTCISLLIINTLNDTFIFIKVMTGGGPNNATQVLGTYMYYQAFENYRFGYGTTIAVANFILALVLTFVVTRLMKKEDLDYA